LSRSCWPFFLHAAVFFGLRASISGPKPHKGFFSLEEPPSTRTMSQQWAPLFSPFFSTLLFPVAFSNLTSLPFVVVTLLGFHSHLRRGIVPSLFPAHLFLGFDYRSSSPGVCVQLYLRQSVQNPPPHLLRAIVSFLMVLDFGRSARLSQHRQTSLLMGSWAPSRLVFTGNLVPDKTLCPPASVADEPAISQSPPVTLLPRSCPFFGFLSKFNHWWFSCLVLFFLL